MFEPLLTRVREAEEKEDWFEERTQRHIDLVNKYARKIADANIPEVDSEELLAQVENHDASKKEEPERKPYIELTWKHKHDNWDGYKTPGTISDEEINRATLHHITGNSHHPEFWNKEEANIDPTNRDKSVKCIDASKMPPVAVAEMVADWAAMSEELGKNTATEWFEKQKDVRWHFSDDQVDLIYKLLDAVETEEDEVMEASEQTFVVLRKKNVVVKDAQEGKELKSKLRALGIPASVMSYNKGTWKDLEGAH